MTSFYINIYYQLHLRKMLSKNYTKTVSTALRVLYQNAK